MGWIATFIVLGTTPPAAEAQLAECEQIDQALRVESPGGCIAKSLSQQIGAGQGDAYTPWSSIYLIKRDPARDTARPAALPTQIHSGGRAWPASQPFLIRRHHATPRARGGAG
jgi:hypothetical protein